MPGADARPVRIADRAGAEVFLAELTRTMRALEAVLEAESAGIRAGRLREALGEATRKAELASTYVAGLETAKANAVALARLAPEGLEALKAAHRRFTGVAEANGIVLATARTVSEGLIRTLAEEIGRARAPTLYGASPPAPSPYGRGAARSGPLVLSRSL